MEITLHLGQCSDCFREFTEFGLRYKDSRRRLWLGVGAAAAVALLVAGTLYFGSKSLNRVGPQPDRIANSPASVEPSSVKSSPVSPSTTEVAKIETPLPVVDYQLVSPTRGPATSTTQPKELILKRERLRLRIHLPVGSEEGTYEIRLHRASDKKRIVTYERSADRQSKFTLAIEDDFAKLPAGSYLLAVFSPGLTGAVQAYPLRVIGREGQ